MLWIFDLGESARIRIGFYNVVCNALRAMWTCEISANVHLNARARLKIIKHVLEYLRTFENKYGRLKISTDVWKYVRTFENMYERLKISTHVWKYVRTFEIAYNTIETKNACIELRTLEQVYCK